MNRSENTPWIDSDLSELIATIQSGQRPYGGVTEDGGDIPSLGGENIREGGGIELSGVKKVSSEFFRSMTKGVLADQDVLINKDGANTGKVGIYEGQFPVASINEHLFLLRGKAHRIAQGFLYRVLSSEDGQRAIRAKISGSAQPGLKSDFIRKFPVRVPESIVEQSRIAAVLDSVDEAIAKTEAVIAKLKQIRAGLLHDLLTRGFDQHGHLRDPIAGPEEFKDSTLGYIPRGWHPTRLGELLSLVYRYPTYSGIRYVAEGVPEIRGELLRDDGSLSDNVADYRFISEETASRFPKVRLGEDDIVMSVRGTLGKLALVPPHLAGAVITANLIRLVLDKAKVEPEWMMRVMRSERFQQALVNSASATTIQTIQVPQLESIQLALPPKPEQREVLNVLCALERDLKNETTTFEKLGRLKAGLMADLLTGRVRVPESLFTTAGAP